MWNNIEKTAYQDYPAKGPGFFDFLQLIRWRFLVPSFEHAADELPEKRKKVIHPFGSVGKTRWIPKGESPYSGLFETGAIGLIRLSLAIDGGSFTPGIGLKLLVDGEPSVNLVAMNSLDGQGENLNFFEKPLRTKIGPPQSGVLRLLVGPFTKAIEFINPDTSPFKLPVDHFARLYPDGKKVELVKAPDILVFTALQGIQQDPTDLRDHRDKLKALGPGQVLYQVFTNNNESRKIIAEIVLDSIFIASDYGDNRLFFQHYAGQ